MSGLRLATKGCIIALSQSFLRNRCRFPLPVSHKFLPKQARFPTSFSQNRPGFPHSFFKKMEKGSSLLWPMGPQDASKLANHALVVAQQLGARQLSAPAAVRTREGQNSSYVTFWPSPVSFRGFFWGSVGFPLRFSRRWARFPAKLLETCFFKPPKFPKKLLETLTQGKSQPQAEPLRHSLVYM